MCTQVTPVLRHHTKPASKPVADTLRPDSPPECRVSDKEKGLNHKLGRLRSQEARVVSLGMNPEEKHQSSRARHLNTAWMKANYLLLQNAVSISRMLRGRYVKGRWEDSTVSKRFWKLKVSSK